MIILYLFAFIVIVAAISIVAAVLWGAGENEKNHDETNDL